MPEQSLSASEGVRQSQAKNLAVVNDPSDFIDGGDGLWYTVERFLEDSPNTHDA
jgi:hypothetical protein